MIVRVLVGGMLVLLSLPILLPLIVGTLITGAIHGVRALEGADRQVAMSDAAHRPLRAGKSRGGGKQLLVRYPDVALVILAAPIALLLGAPAAGYAIGSAAWVLLRLFGVAVDRRASAVTHWTEQAALRLSYRSLRLVLLVAATLLALSAGGKHDGLTALAVIVVAFTLQLPAALSRSHTRSATSER